MKTINKVILLGNLGRDVEMRYTASGEAMANCQVATSSEWKNRESGERQSATEWHRCVAWGKLAELIGQYCRKGSTVYFEGKLRTRKWQDNQGADQYTTELVVDDFISLDHRDSSEDALKATGRAADGKPGGENASAAKAREAAH
jgi:single-strand DNA-binding protein